MKLTHGLIADNFKNHGFSLVEVMVALGILGTISLGVMKVSENMNRTGKNMGQQLDAVQLSSKVQSLLRDKDVCNNTFAGRTLGNDLVATNGGIIDGEGQIVVGLNTQYGNLTITGMFFQEVSGPMGTSTIPNPDATSPQPYIDVIKRTGRIRLELKKGTHTEDDINKKTTIGTLEIFKFFEMMFYVNPANEIISCYTDNAQYVEAACNSLEGTLHGALCRSINIYDTPLSPPPATGGPGNPANPLAATFHGNVTITNVDASGGGAGNLVVHGNTTLGDQATDLTRIMGNSIIGNQVSNTLVVNGTVTGVLRIGTAPSANYDLCYKGRCVTSWDVSVKNGSCITTSANVCPVGRPFVIGVFNRGELGWDLRCCTAEVE